LRELELSSLTFSYDALAANAVKFHRAGGEAGRPVETGVGRLLPFDFSGLYLETTLTSPHSRIIRENSPLIPLMTRKLPVGILLAASQAMLLKNNAISR
jgi:hypothetical protein